MFQKVCVASLVAALAALCFAAGTALAQDKKSGTVIGEVKATKDLPGGKNVSIDVLAPGEEKARSYHVMFDAKIKGPLPKVLAAVRAAKIGDRVQIEWVATGHGPAIRTFEVLNKATGSDKKGDGDKK